MLNFRVSQRFDKERYRKAVHDTCLDADLGVDGQEEYQLAIGEVRVTVASKFKLPVPVPV